MPRFEVEGYGRDSNRKRKRVYVAEDEEDAIYKAGDDGTIVGKVTRLPEKKPTGKPVRHFFTKVVGVTYDNDDGTSRQAIIARCQTLEELVLDHDEGNVYDANAVKVCRENGEQLGHLGAELAEEIVGMSGRGWTYAAFIAAITGGGSQPIYGVNLLIVASQPGVSAEEAQRYVDGIDLGVR